MKKSEFINQMKLGNRPNLENVDLSEFSDKDMFYIEAEVCSINALIEQEIDMRFDKIKVNKDWMISLKSKFGNSKAENLRAQADAEDNDLVALSLLKKAEREDRWEDFFNDLAPLLTGIDKAIISVNYNQFYVKILTVKHGLIQYFPKSNKVLINKENKWITNGKKWIVENIIGSESV